MLTDNQEIFGTLYSCPWNICSVSGAVGLNFHSHPSWVKNPLWEGLRKQYCLGRCGKDTAVQLCTSTLHLCTGALRILQRNWKRWEPEIHQILPLVDDTLWPWKPLPLTCLLLQMPKETSSDNTCPYGKYARLLFWTVSCEFAVLNCKIGFDKRRQRISSSRYPLTSKANLLTRCLTPSFRSWVDT